MGRQPMSARRTRSADPDASRRLLREESSARVGVCLKKLILRTESIGRHWDGLSRAYLSLPFLSFRLLCTSTSHFPLQLQEQKTRVEQFLAEARMRRVSVISRVATEIREPSAVFLIASQRIFHCRRPVKLMLPEVRVQRL